ncbi:ATP-binding protein [Flexivirga caeni]|uniref:ATP-binding protein n=1 Tax=Flexivirga caeni TaxID=2294115 RepID=A0A3M9MHA8_9MICO|nr:ATP-binding protein [Flexivirga caeni]RNI24906.1 ATP-binding protein [Flexivirga caeni]
MVQPSPYTPGAVARETPGRNQQLAQINERLELMSSLGRLVPRIRVDHGPRGVGKTSLLRQAEQRALAKDAATIWVTAGESAGLVPAIADGAERMVRRWPKRLRERVTDALSTLELKVSGGVPGVASIEAAWSAPGASRRARGATRQFEDLVVATVESARERRFSGLVLLVDEVQAADPASLRTISYAWQHFQSERRMLPVALFAAGLPESVTLINQAVSNSERFAYRQLKDLAPDAVALALATPARELGVGWSAAAIDAAVRYAAGYPHTVQLIGENAWRHAGFPNPGAVIKREHVDAAAADAEEDLRELFTARLSKVTRQGELDIVLAMAALGDGPVRRSAVAAAIGKTSDALGVPRGRLIGAGIISDTSHGYLEFTVPGFAAFVRETHDIAAPAD